MWRGVPLGEVTGINGAAAGDGKIYAKTASVVPMAISDYQAGKAFATMRLPATRSPPTPTAR